MLGVHRQRRERQSLFLGILHKLLGDYAGSTSWDTFDAATSEARGDLAKLRGCRIVTVIESNDDARLNEARIKNVTGSDKVTARALYANSFDYIPTYKIWFATNNRPRIVGTDNGRGMTNYKDGEGGGISRVEYELEIDLVVRRNRVVLEERRLARLVADGLIDAGVSAGPEDERRRGGHRDGLGPELGIRIRPEALRQTRHALPVGRHVEARQGEARRHPPA